MKRGFWTAGFLVLSLSYMFAEEPISLPGEAAQSQLYKDAFNKEVPLCQRGYVTVLIGCTENTQKPCRIATRALDELRGLKNLKLVVVVDMRSSFGGFLPGLVRDQMRSDLKTESARLRPFYQKNGNPGDPLADVNVIPDFDGKACSELGWSGPLKKLCAVVFDPQCGEVRRWDSLEDYLDFQKIVRQSVGATAEKAEVMP